MKKIFCLTALFVVACGSQVVEFPEGTAPVSVPCDCDDAGVPDPTPVPEPLPEVDAGSPLPEVDASVPTDDAGPVEDAGQPQNDAGSVEDAGQPSEDAGDPRSCEERRDCCRSACKTTEHSCHARKACYVRCEKEYRVCKGRKCSGEHSDNESENGEEHESQHAE